MDSHFPINNQPPGNGLPPLRRTTSQTQPNFPIPHAPQGPPTPEDEQPHKKRNFEEIKPDDDLNSAQASGEQRRRVVVNPKSIANHINELSNKVARTPEAAPQFVKEYIESTLALPQTKGNKATVVRELFRAIDDGKFGENTEAVHAALNEYAYPANERQTDRERIHALAAQKFPDNEELRNKFITLMEELFSEKRGITPSWITTKREHPKTNLTMERSVTFSSLHSRVKSPQQPQSGSSALSSLSSSLLSSSLSRHPPSLLKPNQTTTTGYLQDPDFQKICERHLPGIGLQKGGVAGITNIMTDGILVATWHGQISPVLPGAPPDTCATLHGPLFAILDNTSAEYKRNVGEVSEFPEDSVLCYLVPSTAEKERISEALAFGKEYGIISPEEEQRLNAKVKTFQEFNREKDL